MFICFRMVAENIRRRIESSSSEDDFGSKKGPCEVAETDKNKLFDSLFECEDDVVPSPEEEQLCTESPPQENLTDENRLELLENQVLTPQAKAIVPKDENHSSGLFLLPSEHMKPPSTKPCLRTTVLKSSSNINVSLSFLSSDASSMNSDISQGVNRALALTMESSSSFSSQLRKKGTPLGVTYVVEEKETHNRSEFSSELSFQDWWIYGC